MNSQTENKRTSPGMIVGEDHALLERKLLQDLCQNIQLKEIFKIIASLDSLSLRYRTTLRFSDRLIMYLYNFVVTDHKP